MFHKDSMKIARDFITGEMSVNKNEYADRASEGARRRGTEGRERARGAFLFIRALYFFFLDLSTSAPDDGRRFESAISRRTRKLCRLDHS